MSSALLAAPARWVEERWGAPHLARLAAACGLAPDEVGLRDRWLSHAQVERFLAGVRDLAGTDDVFATACAHARPRDLGAWRYLLWASTPSRLVERLEASLPPLSRVSRYEVEDHGRGFLTVRYASEVAESQLMCLQRQAQLQAEPTLWELPPARVREVGCLARGDDACTYELRLYEPERRSQALVGAALGAVAATALLLLGWTELPAWLLLPPLGATLAHLLEHRKKARANIEIAHQVQQSVGELVTAAQDARLELDYMLRRQEAWAAELERRLLETERCIPVGQPGAVPTRMLVQRFQQRARALVHGRDVRVVVAADRRMPEQIQTIPLVFDRVLDHLVADSARRAGAGTMKVLLPTSPLYFTVKIVEGSGGIDPEELERRLAPVEEGGPIVTARRRGSAVRK